MTHPANPALRAHRGFLYGEMIVAAFRVAIAGMRRALARRQRRRQARSFRETLNQLDDRTLRDIGLDRSEIGSIVAEVTGESDLTRVHSLWTSAGFPK